MNQKPVAVSRQSANYENWMWMLSPGILMEDFGKRDPRDFTSDPHGYSGLLLTGGGDIDPGRYGCAGQRSLCLGIDSQRDECEFLMATAALEHGIPILGICRGLQVINILLEGTLIPDIPAYSGITFHKGKGDTEHGIMVESGSWLQAISGSLSGTVNSSHHQCIGNPGKNIRITARSKDGVAEAIEYNGNHDFCIGVQWHPERMLFENPFSSGVGKAFAEAIGCRL